MILGPGVFCTFCVRAPRSSPVPLTVLSRARTSTPQCQENARVIARSNLQPGIRFASARRMMSIATRALIFAAAIGASACSPYLPPTTVPPTPDAEVEPFRTALQAYVDQTQPYRKQAAQAGNQVSGQTGAAPNAEAGVRARQNTLAEALSTKLRPNAMQGDLIVPVAAATIRQNVMQVFSSTKHDLLMDALAEQNDTGKGSSPAPPIAI